MPRPLQEIEVDIRPIASLLAEASTALGRLDAATRFLPNPDLFVKMYVRKEAVLSSQIEGTHASLTDVLDEEAGVSHRERRDDVEEIRNYIDALNFAVGELDRLPISVRLLRKSHERGVRTVAADGSRTASDIQGLRERHRQLVTSQVSGTDGHVLLDALFEAPVTTVNRVQEIIGKSYPVANKLVAEFEAHGILREITGQKRNRRYRYEAYVDIFGELAP